MDAGEIVIVAHSDLREAVVDYLAVTGRPVGGAHVFDCRCFTDPHRARRPNHVGAAGRKSWAGSMGQIKHAS